MSSLTPIEAPRHELVDPVDLVVWQAFENPCQPGLGIDIAHLGGLDEGVGDGGSLAAADRAHEQI